MCEEKKDSYNEERDLVQLILVGSFNVKSVHTTFSFKGLESMPLTKDEADDRLFRQDNE